MAERRLWALRAAAYPHMEDGSRAAMVEQLERAILGEDQFRAEQERRWADARADLRRLLSGGTV